MEEIEVIGCLVPEFRSESIVDAERNFARKHNVFMLLRVSVYYCVT